MKMTPEEEFYAALGRMARKYGREATQEAFNREIVQVFVEGERRPGEPPPVGILGTPAPP